MSNLKRFSIFATLTFLPMTLAWSRSTARISSEQKFCLKSLHSHAKEEASSLVFEQWSLEETRDIDTSAVDKVVCDVKIKKGSFKVIDPSDQVCQAKAEYQGSCSFPKIGGGFLEKTLPVEGDGCCLIKEAEEPAGSQKSSKATSSHPKVSPTKGPQQGQK